ncbi:hypothetical protein MICAE_960046 [Microcystis aeruginosa PCC 9806]|uniref:Uncharacterized protein n=1 Tax=Microcystis aeruginosa PCC 9806 TaxID=1160282 RepID=I4H3W3_MICAE|nr:hypothetical protein [Microcystis aeruginosa]CCI16737.1 hypothetical protein MICAE_960046 [Microcystis aeruginosa PCC 9806]
MENISQWVGIDISKATLDVYLRPLGKAMKVNLVFAALFSGLRF